MSCCNQEFEIQFVKLDNSKENYKILLSYYQQLDSSFVPPLSSYLDIEEYTKKLINNAYICLLKSKEQFIGLFAIYVNDTINKIAFFTSLGVLDEYKGKGYSQLLMKEAIRIAKESGMKILKLEVKSEYTRAVKFHEKMGFKRRDEATKDDSTFYMYKNLSEKE